MYYCTLTLKMYMTNDTPLINTVGFSITLLAIIVHSLIIVLFYGPKKYLNSVSYIL